MKVYIVKENFYNYDSGEEVTSVITAVYNAREKAVKKRKEIIADNISNFGFIVDEEITKKHEGNTSNLDLIILFWDFQENWNNYIELEIIEKEVL